VSKSDLCLRCGQPGHTSSSCRKTYALQLGGVTLWGVAGILLALSVGANVWQQLRIESLQKKVGTLTAQADTAVASAQSWKGAAESCSAATQRLQAAAATNAASAARANKLAKDVAYAHSKLARSIQTGQSAVPGDACKSADAVFNEWIERRRP
jgi:hypothetical protein